MVKRSTTKGQTELIDFAEVKHQQRGEEDAAYIDALRWALADLLWYVQGDDGPEARHVKATAQELLDRGDDPWPCD
jgi:hypothetical protein